eukprot:TRINITY_DN40095_c0_g1_i1.p1 TRINITY_DN40095_c0_g1~~TRINITY_DN40095_c0_g1_i1.p1  ORF type:complete len:692 (+),score=234.79 TRINITY_DN40095_c0_g1_i1:96-2171(+)
MKYVALAALLANLAEGLAEENAVTPAQKVVQLLKNMKEKGRVEMNEEKVQFAKYSEWCKLTAKDKNKVIDEAAELIEVSLATIKKSASDVERLTEEISGHDADLNEATDAKSKATEVREAEAADYAKIEQDYAESVDAMGRAIKVLKKQDFNRAQAKEPSLLQKKTTNGLGIRASALMALSDSSSVMDAGKAVAEFLTATQSDKPGVAHAYKFQSGNVIEMLTKLQTKFVKEKREVEKAEEKKKSAYEVLAGSLQIQMDDASRAKEKKQEFRSKAQSRKAEAEDTLSTTRDTQATDQKYLADLNTECSMKATDFKSRQKLRVEELEAVDKAVEILSGDTVQAAASKHLPSLVQEKKAALAALRTRRSSEPWEQALEFVDKKASELHSSALTQLVTKARAKTEATPAANTGALKMIGDMLQELLGKLQKEAEEDATQKLWCDNEMSTNMQTRSAKTEDIDKLTSEIDGLQTSITQLTESTSDLNGEISKLQKAMKDATQLRNEEKNKNEVTIRDSKEASVALDKALEVLRAFYDKAGEADAFIQTGAKVKHSQKPEIFDRAYKGMGGENGGVVGMLEVLLSDFERLVAQTEASETAALTEYSDFMEDSKVDVSKKRATVTHQEKLNTEQSNALQMRKSDLDGTQKELAAANKVYEEIKDKCLNSAADFEKEVQRREESIQALKEALEMLSNA